MHQLDEKSYQNMAKIARIQQGRHPKHKLHHAHFFLPILTCKVFIKISRNILKSHRKFLGILSNILKPAVV
jgi:hypothetical protein